MIQATASSPYAMSQPVTLVLPGATNTITTASSGVATLNLAISALDINSFAVRYGSAFDEVRLLSVKLELRPLTASTGVTNFFWSEKPIATANLSQASQRPTRILGNSNGTGNSLYVMNWHATGFLDLSWEPITAASASVYFNAYTDIGNYGSPASTNLWLIRPILTLQMRGVASV